MNKRELVIELQTNLSLLNDEICKMDFEFDKYNKRKILFSTFDEEFKIIIKKIPANFYLNDESDKELLEEINRLNDKIKSTFVSLKSTNTK